MTSSKDHLTHTVIKKWAYQQPKQQPLPQLEDLETIVEHADLLLALVSDSECPQQEYILNCFYLLVGNGVSRHENDDIQQIQILLDKVTSEHSIIVINWATRVRMILRDLRKYDYVEWCKGGFVHKDLAMV
jgi:hypothetical protein